MNLPGDIFTNLALGFQSMRATSEIERQSIHRIFAAFYNNDYLLINDILKRETLNNPFSEKTLEKMNFQHLNILKKILNRLSSGIYTEQPLRELLLNEKTDEKLLPLLSKIRYSAKVKDAFKKSLYYNCVLVGVVWDDETKKMRLDVISPDNFEVKTKNDYLEISQLKICKARPDGTIFHTIWTESEHYILDGGETYSPPNNESGKNPYGKIPFVILRMEEGCDFYGEPNWNLFLNQKNFDIRLTDLNEAELRTIMGIWHGINTKFQKSQRFAAGELLQSTAADGENISLQSIAMDIDYVSVRENIDWRMKTVMNSEGLSAQSGDTQATQESGIKRIVDELELEERRNDFKEILYNFEIELLNMIRLVYNKHNSDKLNEKGIFEVTFSEEKSTESITDKISRREMESAIGYKDEIDFTMEDLEVDESQAIEILKSRKDRMRILGLENETPQPVDPQESQQV